MEFENETSNNVHENRSDNETQNIEYCEENGLSQDKNVFDEEIEERKHCAGFEENIVLAVKECFFDDEIRCILIKKTKNGRKVKYFSRLCTNTASGKKKVCEICDEWFTCLTVSVDGNFTSKNDTKTLTSVKEETKIKHEGEDDNWTPGKPLEGQEDDQEITGGHKKTIKAKRSSVKSRVNSDEFRVDGGWVCKLEECDTILPLRREWIRHVRSHLGKSKCKMCGSLVAKLPEHIKRRHPEHADKPMSFFTDDNVKKERKTYTRTKAYAWDKEPEANYEEDKDSDGKYNCRYQQCQQLFHNKKSYLKHIFLTHEGGSNNNKRKKICDICGNLITANNMKQHVRTVHTHRNEKNFACEHCGKEYKYKSELTIHLTHHTGEMNFACSGCAKRFRRAAEARLCEKGHRGIFSFRCHLCEYKTNKKNHLDRHIESHLKATPFICPICGFKSGRKDNLKQHVEKRHCSNNVTIKHIEDMYPHIYKIHETSEAAVIAKTEALAENFARMHEKDEVGGDTTVAADRDDIAADGGAATMPSEVADSKIEVDKDVELQGGDKWGNQKFTIHTANLQYNHLQPNDDASTNNMQSLQHHDNGVVDSIKYSNIDQQSSEHIEQKYLPPSDNRYLQEDHERLSMHDQRERILIEQHRREQRDILLLNQQRERERSERDRLAALEMLQEHRDRLGVTDRDRLHQQNTNNTTLADMYHRMRSLE